MRPAPHRYIVRNERSSLIPGRRSLYTMRCSVARLCERTVARRVPLLGAGGGLLHTYSALCRSYRMVGAELASCASHTERRLVPTGANRRRSRDRQRGTSCPKGETSGSERINLRRYGKPHTPLRQGRERAEHFGGWQWRGAGELREPHLPFSMTLQAASLPVLEHQPQQANRCHDQHGPHKPRS
jgi:hypothetical protein